MVWASGHKKQHFCKIVVDKGTYVPYSLGMEDTKDNIAAWLRADISPQQKLEAKRVAKRKGMTFQGWLGQLITRELEQGKSYGNPESR